MERTLKVTPEELIKTSQEFSLRGRTISTLTSEMVKMVSGISNGLWIGLASEAYLAKFKQLDEDILKINAMIQEHVNDLQIMASTYAQAEQSNIESASALSAILFDDDTSSNIDNSGDTSIDQLEVMQMSQLYGIGGISLEDAIIGLLRKASDATVLAFLQEVSKNKYTTITVEKVIEHYKHNRAKWNDILKNKVLKNGFIEEQGLLGDLLYGMETQLPNGKTVSELVGEPNLDTANQNSCEVIALYNALYDLGYEGIKNEKGRYDVNQFFPTLLMLLEGQSALNGNLGTAPQKIKAYLNQWGYDPKLYTGDQITNSKNSISYKSIERNHDTFILSKFNGSDTVMIHTVSITRTSNGKFVVHNNGCTDAKGKLIEYKSLEDAVHAVSNDNNVISIIGADKK